MGRRSDDGNSLGVTLLYYQSKLNIMRHKDYLSVKKAIAQFKRDNKINPFTLKPIKSYEQDNTRRNSRANSKDASRSKC